VELSTRLTEQLSLLAVGSATDGTGLTADLTDLVATLTDAVSGFVGLCLTVVHDGHPVELTAMLPPTSARTVVTSLRMPLPAVSDAFEDGGELVVWSSVPGALVDLAADVGYVLHDRSDGPAGRASPVVALDDDLPRPGAVSGVRGLDELATVHRAAGLLIGQGHDPRSAHDVLRRRAVEEGLSSYELADRLLRRR
jgi:hypothetical protein